MYVCMYVCISFVLPLGNNRFCVSHWDFFCRLFEPIIYLNEAASAAAFSLLQEPLLLFKRWPCLQPLVFSLRLLTRGVGLRGSGCFKGGRTCTLSALKSSARGHLGQARHILPDTFSLSLCYPKPRLVCFQRRRPRFSCLPSGADLP